MYFKKILIPFDGSKFSKKAIKVAMDLAKKYKASITVLNCISGFYTGRWYVDNRIADEQFQKEYQKIKNELKKIKSNAEHEGVKTSIKISETPKIVNKIAEFARKDDVDLIIMGSHGRTGFDKMILGSKAEGTLQRVKCPVMVIK